MLNDTTYGETQILGFCLDHLKMVQNQGNLVLMGIWLALCKKRVKSWNMQNVGMQTQGFTECVCACASVYTCGKEGVFSLFMEFNTCYIDCGINICVCTNRILSSLIWLSCNGKTTPLAVTVIEVPSTQTQNWLWVWRWMMALKNYWMWLSKLLLNYKSMFHLS